MRTIQHPNGLVLSIDERLAVKETPSGYTLTPSDASAMRSPPEIEVRLERGPVQMGATDSKTIDGHEVHYLIERTAVAGSGGQEYIMTAWRYCLDEHVVITQHVQAETEQEADFRAAFQILGHARCRGRK